MNMRSAIGLDSGAACSYKSFKFDLEGSFASFLNGNSIRWLYRDKEHFALGYKPSFYLPDLNLFVDFVEDLDTVDTLSLIDLSNIVFVHKDWREVVEGILSMKDSSFPSENMFSYLRCCK